MKALKKFEFASANGRNSHDWTKLLDGGIYQMDEGTDYNCKTNTMLTLARNAAKKAGKKVKTAKTETGIVIQAVASDAPATTE